MSIEPVSQTVAVGGQTTVNVVGSNFLNLGAFQFTLEFNPSVVSFVRIDPGDVFDGTGRTLVCQPPEVELNSVMFLCVTLGTAPGPSGSGVLARVTFQGAALGLSPLHLTDALLTSINGTVLEPLTTQDGLISVSASVGGSQAGSLGQPLALRASGDALVVGEQSRGVAANVAAVYKDPASANLFLGGGPLVVAERVTGVPAGLGLGAFEIQVLFNETAVDVAIEEGPFLGSTGRETYCLTGYGAGLARLSCFSLGSQPGPSGSGVLAFLTVTPAQTLHLRAAQENGVQTLLDDVSAIVRLNDTSGAQLPLSRVNDASLIVRALEGDVNGDCRVNVVDQQNVASRFGARVGSLAYDARYDLDPSLAPDGDIDIGDVQMVFGRSGSTCSAPQPEQTPPPGQPTPTPKGGPTPTETPTETPSCPDFDGDTVCDNADTDDDDDGCADERELGSNEQFGGRRDPTNFWDFFDVPNPNSTPERDQAISASDIFLVVMRFGNHDAGGTAPVNRTTDPRSPILDNGYHPAYDRSPLGPNVWNLGPPNGSIAVDDIFFTVAQFGHSCR